MGAGPPIESTALDKDRRTRIGNGLLGLFLLACAISEAAKQSGWAVPLLFAGLIGPDLTFLIGIGVQTEHGVLPRGVVPFYNLAHLWPLPILVLAYFGLLTDTTDAAAPGFTLGLAWLAHTCADRALGYGLRTSAGAQR